ncbi:hypothetical protein ACFL4U_03900, partial [Candidatus Neomarinimicrobiota bacterium]
MNTRHAIKSIESFFRPATAGSRDSRTSGWKYGVLILSSFMALLGQISAQQGGGTPGTIAGRVTDAESGAGLPGANVFLKSTN